MEEFRKFLTFKVEFKFFEGCHQNPYLTYCSIILFRYSTEELTLPSYGDSETESDDEDVDFENLDSVSIVAARASSSSSSTCSNGSNAERQLIHRVTSRGHGASPSLDSGRGDSPESSCNSTLVLAPNATTGTIYIVKCLS